MPNPDSSRGGNAPRLDTGDDLLTHDTLAGLSVLAGGPASPQAADHGRQRSAKPARQASGSGQFEERAAARAALAHQ
jgi:hypothetical protein